VRRGRAGARAEGRDVRPLQRAPDAGRDAALGRHPGDGPARRGGRVRLALGARPSHPILRGGRAARRLGVLDARRRPGGRDRARRARHDRDRHQLPQPGAAGQDRRHGGGDQRRAGDPRPGHRLPRAGISRLRLPLRPPLQPLRGGPDDPPRPAAARPDRLRRQVLRGARVRAAPARPAPGRPPDHDRLVRPEDARPARAVRRPLERLAGPRRQPRRGDPAAARAGGRRLPGGRARPGDGGAHRDRAGRLYRHRRRGAAPHAPRLHARADPGRRAGGRGGAARLRRRGHRAPPDLPAAEQPRGDRALRPGAGGRETGGRAL
ncbi:MAG: hypothetical protein AVDCRST_MAG88-3859, partial [uncultured Thermomicrobiales bacterium]